MRLTNNAGHLTTQFNRTAGGRSRSHVERKANFRFADCRRSPDACELALSATSGHSCVEAFTPGTAGVKVEQP